MNPFESSSRINAVVVPEFILHGVLCGLLLLTGHWIMFLFTLPIACYNASLFLKRQHLIDVTEVFRFLSAEKKYRIIKLGFYLVLFVLVIIRVLSAGTFSAILSVFHFNNEELDVRSSFLEFQRLHSMFCPPSSKTWYTPIRVYFLKPFLRRKSPNRRDYYLWIVLLWADKMCKYSHHNFTRNCFCVVIIYSQKGLYFVGIRKLLQKYLKYQLGCMYFSFPSVPHVAPCSHSCSTQRHDFCLR